MEEHGLRHDAVATPVLAPLPYVPAPHTHTHGTMGVTVSAMGALTTVLLGHVKFHGQGTHLTGLVWLMEFHPETDVPGGQKCTHGMMVAFDTGPPGHPYSWRGHGVHTTILDGVLVPTAYWPAGQSVTHGVPDTLEKLPSVEFCAKQAREAGHNVQDTTVVRLFVPLGTVAAGQYMVHGMGGRTFKKGALLLLSRGVATCAYGHACFMDQQSMHMAVSSDPWEKKSELHSLSNAIVSVSVAVLQSVYGSVKKRDMEP